MSAPVGSTPPPNFINELLAVNFQAMQVHLSMEEGRASRCLHCGQTQMRASPLTKNKRNGNSNAGAHKICSMPPSLGGQIAAQTETIT